jgi:hypothetical protein
MDLDLNSIFEFYNVRFIKNLDDKLKLRSKSFNYNNSTKFYKFFPLHVGSKIYYKIW